MSGGSSISTFTKALALVPKVVGALSFVGSLFVAQDIIRNEKKRQSIFHRIMLGLSIFDTMTSLVNMLSTWPTPKGTAGIFLAVGTTATCTAQGFFNEFGNITTPLYSASLCVWYLLFLKYGRKEQDCRQYELAFHVVPISVGLAMAVIGLPLNLYNNSGFLCWYAPFPKGCDQTLPQHTCTRGVHAGIFRWIHYGIIWTAIAFITYAMVSIYVAVRRLEGRAISTMSILSNTSRKKSKAVAGQALLYVCALYLTWFFTTCTRISQTAFKHHSDVLLMLMALFFPLQGFWNALIYVRPQWLHKRRAEQVQSNMMMSRRLSLRPSGGSGGERHSNNSSANESRFFSVRPPSSRVSVTEGRSSIKLSVVSFASNSVSNNNTKDSTEIRVSSNSDDLEQNAKMMLETDPGEAVQCYMSRSDDDDDDDDDDDTHEKIREGVISVQAPLDASGDSSSNSSSNNNNNNNDSSNSSNNTTNNDNDSSSTTNITQPITLTEKGVVE